MINIKTIKQCAADAGFDLCGIARSRPLADEQHRLRRWLDAGYGAGLNYLHRNIDIRSNPSSLVEDAKSIIVCAVSYKDDTCNTHDGELQIASFAQRADYHTVIKGMLTDMLNKIQLSNPQIKGRCFVDSAPILEKKWAVEAGLGASGKNSLLITPHYGSYVLLGEIVIDAPMDEYDTPFTKDLCRECRRCIDSCPTGAICEPHTIDTRRCIARLTIENEPEEFSSNQLNGWIFGCDECQRRCPYNAKALNRNNYMLQPITTPLHNTKAFWQNVSPQEFAHTFSNTPLMRCGLERLKSFIFENEQ